MASIDHPERNELIALTIGMFNAAPGASYLGNLVLMYEMGRPVLDIARTLAARPEFAQIYPSALSADEFATSLIANLLGNETGEAATRWALNWVKAKLAAGEDRASTIATAVHHLHYSTNDDFAKAKAMLLNKIDVASYYSVTKLMSSTVLTDLQSVIARVTSDAASAVTSKAAIDNAIVDPPFYTFTLSAGVDNIVASAGNDSIYASTTGALSAGDLVDGGAGADAFSIYDYERIDIPGSVVVRSVETVSMRALVGVTGDVSGWTGLTSLKVTSMAGDIKIKAAATTDVSIVISKADLAIVNVVTVDISGGHSVSITSNSSAVTTVLGPHAGMKLILDTTGNVTFTPTKVTLAASATLEDYLSAIANAGTAGTTEVRWFQYQGNTYIADTNFVVTASSGINPDIKLLSLVDLSAAEFSAVAGSPASLTLS